MSCSSSSIGSSSSCKICHVFYDEDDLENSRDKTYIIIVYKKTALLKKLSYWIFENNFYKTCII